MGEVKSQATTQIIDLQEDFLGVEKRRWMLANNKDIPVMTSRQVSGGFDYNKQRWLISTEGFYKTVDGITTKYSRIPKSKSRTKYQWKLYC